MITPSHLVWIVQKGSTDEVESLVPHSLLVWGLLPSTGPGSAGGEAACRHSRARGSESESGPRSPCAEPVLVCR